jgi:hypothetical protein
MPLLQRVLIDIFGIDAGADLVECNFSLMTTRPENLRPIQRLPHFDSVHRGRIALLHYLCGPEQGATAFFRHRTTGWETISAERLDLYGAEIESDVRRHGMPPARYMSGDDGLFEETLRTNACFNRLVIYRGWTLHSGVVPSNFAYSTDPRAGRLTINTFLQARP